MAEATVYVVDVGKSMGKKNNGREMTNLEWSMQYVWDNITTTVLDGRKTKTLGVLALRSDQTDNEFAEDDDGYSHIAVLQEIRHTVASDVRDLRDAIKPSKTNKGDAISAIAIAAQMLDVYGKKRKAERKIVLVTDGLGSIDSDDIEQIAKKISGDGVTLVILGVDFDDADFGFKEEDKDPGKAQNEEMLRKLAGESGGMIGTMAEAISELGIPRLKEVGVVASYKGQLTLGDPAKYDTAMSISVERYPKTKIAPAPSSSSFVHKADMAASTQTSATVQDGGDGDGDGDGGDGLVSVKSTYSYYVNDPDAPGGKRELDRGDLSKGYNYGRTAVAFDEADQHVVKYETWKSFDIVGFVPSSSYEHHLGMSSTSQIIGSQVNEKDSMAFSSLIHALHETESFAVARFVAKDGKAPVLLLLAPYFETDPDYECLVDVELPFAEDVRSYKFPPLDKVITVGGKNIIQHRNLPTPYLMDAMDDYVDAMDISTFERTEEGLPRQYAAIGETFSPRNGQITKAIMFRAVHPTDEVPPPAEMILKYSNPPEGLLEQAKKPLDNLLITADVKKVPPKQKSRKRGRDTEKPLSGLNVEELLGKEKRVKITPDNAVPEFKQLLATTDEMSVVKDAVKQLSAIIQTYIRTSTGSYAYNRAIEAIRVMKEEMSDLEEPGLFNDFLNELKKKMVSGDLGGDRREMWYLIKVHRLGLIDSNATDLSDISPEEAKAFMVYK